MKDENEDIPIDPIAEFEARIDELEKRIEELDQKLQTVIETLEKILNRRPYQTI